MAPNNPLPIHGNEKTMNLNHLILTNIQSSPYFKVNLYELKTYHEVIDEIYYKVRWGSGNVQTATFSLSPSHRFYLYDSKDLLIIFKFTGIFQVSHLEPWEKGSRKTAGQTGMCGGVGNNSAIL